jgi:hypothetical protein
MCGGEIRLRGKGEVDRVILWVGREWEWSGLVNGIVFIGGVR